MGDLILYMLTIKEKNATLIFPGNDVKIRDYFLRDSYKLQITLLLVE